jgi:hypothetical protein
MRASVGGVAVILVSSGYGVDTERLGHRTAQNGGMADSLDEAKAAVRAAWEAGREVGFL